MQVTIDLPDYVFEVLTREAAYRGITTDMHFANELQRHTDSMMSVWRKMVEWRHCHKCGESNMPLDDFDLKHRGPWRTCVNCGNKLTTRDRKESRKMHDGTVLEGEALAAWYKDLENFLRRARRMRKAIGATPPKYKYFSSTRKRETFAKRMSRHGFSESAIEYMKSA